MAEDFGFVPDENESVPEVPANAKAQTFEQAPPLERALKAPTGAVESYFRGGANLISGIAGQGFGSIYGLGKSLGNIDEAVETGQKAAEKLHIPPFQASSAYFDEQIAKGTEFARNWIGEQATSAKKYKDLDKQTLETLKNEAANRGIAEGVFDNIILPAILGRAIPGKGKAKAAIEKEEGVKPGPTGPQGEFGFTPDEAQGENATPQTMMGQENQSPYNLQQQQIDRLEKELNPPTERRVNEQAELFTDFKDESALGFQPDETPTARTADVAGREDRLENLGEARDTGQFGGEPTGFPRLGEPPDQWINHGLVPVETLTGEPSRPGSATNVALAALRKRQGGVIDKDLLTLGVGHFLQSEGFRNVMKRFKGTFSEKEILKALRESDDPRSQTTTIFMSPDKFHELAEKRILTEGRYPEWKRGNVREALKTEKGLDAIPELYLSQEPEGTSVYAHDGRHRMDVFKEQGMDLIPVQVHHNTLSWGKASQIGKIPREVVSENGVRTEFPEPENWKQGKDLDFTNKPISSTGPIGRQRGAVDLRSEPDLIKAAKEGDNKAFESLFKSNYNRLVKIAKRVVKDEDVAHDVVQETMIKAHEHLGEFEGKSKFSTWLYRIAVNEAKNQLRSHNLKGGVDVPDEVLERFIPRHEDTPENIMQGKERAEGINAAWDRLDNEQQLILEMREIEGMDYQKIADTLGVPIGTVRSRIARARDDLASNIKGKGLGQTQIGKSQRGSIGWFDKQVDKEVDKKGLVGTLLDARKQFQMMKEPLKNYIQGLKPEGVKDIGATFKMGTNALTDRSASILAENEGPVGKIIKWAVDQMTMADDKSDAAHERDLYGEQYKKGSLFSKLDERVRSEAGALTLWKEAHKTSAGRAELAEMKEKAVANIGIKTLTREDFKTERQFKIYDAVQKNLENKRSEVNAARAKINLPPIPRIEGYLPASWEGDYRVHVYDGLGNHKSSFGFQTKLMANRARNALMEEHPDMDVKPVAAADIDKGQVGDLTAFEQAIKALSSDDPVAKALQATMVKLRSSKGFGRHGLQRKGITGFLGMEPGDTGVRNMERSLEQWFRQANRYISNIEKADAQKQINDIPLEVQKKIPRALDYINDYINQSRGADVDQAPIIANALGALSDRLGTGANGPRKLVQKLSSLTSLYFLTTPRFVVSQMAQHQNAVAKYVQLLHEGSMEGPLGNWVNNVPLGKLVNAEFIAMKGWHQFFSPDDVAVRGANAAQKLGKLDSAIVAMLNMKLSDVTSERTKMIKDGVQWGMGKLEKNMVRLPTFFAFEHAMRESIPNEALRFETAANMMDHYMVHYGSTSSPVMYGKLGLLGDAAKTFKQYSHNAFGQFFEYLDYAKQKGGSVEPFMAHVGMQAAIGGLKGTVLVAEAAALTSLLNKALPDDWQIPNVQDLLMNSRLHDLLVFGGLSTALGYDVSSSVNAPNVPQMFSAPSAEFTYKAVTAARDYIKKVLDGTVTDQDEMKAMLALSPSAMHGWVEEHFSKPGQPVPRPNEKMKGNIVRTPTEKTAAKIFSVKSLREARDNAMISAAKRELAQSMNSKTSELDAIVDRIENGQKLDSSLIQRYVKNGGDASKLSEHVVKRMQERQMEYLTRQMPKNNGKELTPNQIHKLTVMKDLLNRRSQEQHQTNKELNFQEDEEQE